MQKLNEKLIQLNEMPFSLWNNFDGGDYAGIYIISDRNEDIIYIGESTNIRTRYRTHSKNTRFSAFRRNIATNILNITLKTKQELGVLNSNDKKCLFVTKDEDEAIDEYIKTCRIKAISMTTERQNFEKLLINEFLPKLNRKYISG